MRTHKQIVKEIYEDAFDGAILGDGIILECSYCKDKSSLVKEQYIPASPCGAGGDYILCPCCTICFLEEAEHSLAEYYASIM